MTIVPIVIEKLARESMEEKARNRAIIDALYAEGIERAKASGVPVIKRLFASPYTDIRGELEDGKVVTKVKSVVIPRRIFPTLNTRADDAWSLNHEMSEAEAVNRGGLRPVHSHGDTRVLAEEAALLMRMPEKYREQFSKAREEDMDWAGEIFGHESDDKKTNVSPTYEDNIKKMLKGNKVSLPSLNKSYAESEAYKRSMLYEGYISDMVRRAAGKDKEDDKDNLYNMLNPILHPSLKYDHEKEKETALEIYREAKKSAATGSVIGALIGIAMTAPIASAPTNSKGLMGTIMGVGGAVGGSLGYGIGDAVGEVKGMEKHYWSKDKHSKKETK